MQLGNKTLQLPIIQGGMGVGISLGGLAGAVAREGGMGVISTANPGFREPDYWENPKLANARALSAEIKKAKEIAQGNGLVAINAMAAGREYETILKKALENGVDAVISGAGLPLTLPEVAKGFDTLLAPIVSSGRAAALICRTWQKRYDRLPDFVVLEGAGAGGHLGFVAEEVMNGTTKSLDELFIEVKEALSAFGKIPLFVAGSVYSGSEVAQWVKKGAAGVQIATRFIATHECDASDEYKQIILNAKESDICIVKSPVGMPGRALRSPLITKLEQGGRIPPKRCVACLIPCKSDTTPYCISSALDDGFWGKWETGLFFCGENAGKINKLVSVKELMDELTAEWRQL